MIDKKQTSENRRILQIAIPSIISNITVPLLGLIDVTIVGHLGSPAYIGAIAVGGMLFNIIYWIFGFLRMGTSGMTSQAYGQHDLNEITRLLLRSVGVGLFIAVCLLVLQYPILKLAFTPKTPVWRMPRLSRASMVEPMPRLSLSQQWLLAITAMSMPISAIASATSTGEQKHG